MTVRELAGELGVDEQALMRKFNKPDVESELTEEEIALAVEGDEAETESGVPAKAITDGDVVRFISNVRKHAFVCISAHPETGLEQQTFVNFEDFKLDVALDGLAYKTVLDLKSPDIRVLVHEPFEDVGKRKEFRDRLEEQLITGPRREPSMERGLAFVQSLFRKDERDEVAQVLHKHGPIALIEMAVTRKSWIQSAEV